MSKSALFMIACALGGAVCLPARAETIESFYKGKTVTIVVSTGVGGVFDLTARTVAKYLPKYIAGRPTVIVKNMPGGGHVLATNFMFSQAAKDGTFLALVNNGMPLHQVLDGRGVRFDAVKFIRFGSAGLSNLMTVLAHLGREDGRRPHDPRAGHRGDRRRLQRLHLSQCHERRARHQVQDRAGLQEQPGGRSRHGAGRGRGPRGLPSLSAIPQEHPDWITDKKVAVLVQVGSRARSDFPDVPLMHELAKTPEQRQTLALISSPVSLGRPFFTTPDTPAERVAALREAYDAVMKDEDFLAEARALNLDVKPMGGERVTQIVDETINVPAAPGRRRPRPCSRCWPAASARSWRMLLRAASA